MQRQRLHKEATLRDATGREAVDLVANPLRRPRLRVRDRLGHVVAAAAAAAAAAVSGVRQQTIREVSSAERCTKFSPPETAGDLLHSIHTIDHDSL